MDFQRRGVRKLPYGQCRCRLSRNGLGAPPSAQTGTWADYGHGSSKVTTYIYRKSNKTGEWNAYAEGGNIDMHNSTFSSTYATEPSKRPLLYIDKMAGYYISFK